MAEKESGSQGSTEALGLYSRTPMKKGDDSTAKGNEDGNQRPVCNPKSIGGGFKTK